MSDHYSVQKDGDGVRWDWLNIPLARFPYTIWRGGEYPWCAMVNNAPTLKWAERVIRKDQRRREKIGSGAGKVTVLVVPADPRELPDLRTVPEYAPQA